MIDESILAKQRAYAARKWSARIETRWFAGTFRFETFAEAIEYLRDQAKRLTETEWTRNFRFEVEGPGGRIPDGYAYGWGLTNLVFN